MWPPISAVANRGPHVVLVPTLPADLGGGEPAPKVGPRPSRLRFVGICATNLCLGRLAFPHPTHGNPRGMATKIQRARRIGGIASGTIKAIFRTGRAWGTARTRVRTARRPAPTVSTGAAVAAGAAGGAAGAYFLDPQQGKRRRHVAFDRLLALLRRGKAESERKARYAAGVAKGAAAEAAGAGEGAEWLPDPELANKVRSEIFRGEDAPKGDVNVNAENGVVYLRGQVDSPEDVQRLATQAREVTGVREVVNLLHPPGEPAPTKESVGTGR